MKPHCNRRLRRILTAVLLYLLLCGFLWCFLLVETRSYNRLSHTPVAMAQVQLDDSQFSCALADDTFCFEMPVGNDIVCFWIEALSDPAISTAQMLWELLTSSDIG